MTRIVAILLLLLVVSADLAGTRLMNRDNRRCAAIGQAVERHGITAREQAKLDRWHCEKRGGVWQSDRFYPA